MPSLAHDRRGFLVGGPGFVTPSDVLARLIGFQHCIVSAPNPAEQHRQYRIYQGRAAAARIGRRVRPWECR
jgi:hypothetical protein